MANRRAMAIVSFVSVLILVGLTDWGTAAFIDLAANVGELVAELGCRIGFLADMASPWCA
jgi:hypothetical protein